MKSRTRRLRHVLSALAPIALFLGSFGGLICFRIRQERLNDKLIEAIQREDLSAARALLNQGASANACWKPPSQKGTWQSLWDIFRIRNSRRQKNSYSTALMLASERGNTALASLLLDRGADVNASAKGDFTPLMDAAMCGHPDTVRFL